ncbi:DUF3347 domain-containing protein [Pedobacter sp. AW1-32]|uniref:DUF3347 domain-containing protein n=1 Tax=Pedobacter sp. AW1-32 TaxID=3383026 RepID=UPI003FEF7EF6
MKNLKIIFLSLLLVSALTSSAQYDVAKRDTLKKGIVQDYILLKDNLFASDSLKAVKAANHYAENLAAFKFKKLTLDDMNAHTNARKELVMLAKEIAATKNINLQRKKFSQLSAKFMLIMDQVKPEGEKLYQQQCPMTGDTWISTVETIQNPYFPKNMANCGVIKSTL